jgi:hypothetical protein
VDHLTAVTSTRGSSQSFILVSICVRVEVKKMELELPSFLGVGFPPYDQRGRPHLKHVGFLFLRITFRGQLSTSLLFQRTIALGTEHWAASQMLRIT